MAKEFLTSPRTCFDIEQLYNIFPELRELEDERIKKAILELVRQSSEVLDRQNQNNMIAWLEKQGNLKSDEWKEGDVVRHGGVLALVTNGRRAIKSNLEQITIQYPDEWVKAETKERKYFFDELEKQDKFIENNEDDSDTDFIIYHPLKNGKGRYECIPYSFYGMLSSFSEDKDMIDFLRLCFYTEEECNEWIKQNESTDKVESKFHEGDWIVWQNKCYKVNYNECGYELIDQNGLSTSLEYGTVDKSASIFTIEDAKDGDVLATENFIFVFKNIDNGNGVHYYCHYEINKHEDCNQFGVALPQSLMGRVGNSISHYSPATKEQCDTLMKAMADAGYTFDFGKKELKKIEKKSQRMVSAEAKEALYDKPTDEEMKELLRTEYEKGRADAIAEMKSSWSEEDKKKLNSIYQLIAEAADEHAFSTTCRIIGNKECVDLQDFLKSLKDRVQPQPKQEWSEKDEKILNNLIDYIKVDDALQYSEKQVVDWLKSLKERIKL
ncbi:hypothetical protein [uncultured Eubacterium sp.]|uniref:hypothetical protein n=1 Tax=uncultured Eubacterium sp. TaxID=165185 RepID=UPI002596CA40|nr:hypothetical protein [uncultured Eubacterium sp.]